MEVDWAEVQEGGEIYSSPIQGTKILKGTYRGNEVAIKKLFLHSANDLEAVNNEMNTQIQLKAHPNICQIIGWQHDSKRAVIILELMSLDLAKEIANRKKNEYPWKTQELREYFAQLVDVFAYAQRLKISHRDIKPQNIFLTSRKEIKVGDFGAAKQMKLDLTSTLQGSPYYLSPELKLRFRCMSPIMSDYNPYRADVYSLGLTFLQMILLEMSEKLQNLEQISMNTELILSGERISPFKALLTAMLAPNPDTRPSFLELQDSGLIPRLDLVSPEKPVEQEIPLQLPSEAVCNYCQKQDLVLPFPSADCARTYLCLQCSTLIRHYQPLYFTEVNIWLDFHMPSSR